MPMLTTYRKTPATRQPFHLLRCNNSSGHRSINLKPRPPNWRPAFQQLNVPGISGPVAAYSVPANIGELTLTLTSEVNKQTSVFAPNVLILDQNMTPSAFFPSSYFTYQEPGVMSADRLEGVMRLTPALGQQKLYVLVFTTEKISSRRPNCSTRLKPMPRASVTRSRISPIRLLVIPPMAY